MPTIGKMQITGQVVARHWRDSDWGLIPKMTVRDDRGFTVWSTVPAAINPAIGDRVQFTATIVQSDDNPFMAFASRPCKASILTGEEATQQMLAIA
jgi:hypothetical protein